MDEVELVEGIGSGNQAAKNEFVKRFQEPIYNLLFHLAGCKEDAEDFTQEALIRLIEHLQTGEFQYRTPGEFRGFIRKTVMHLFFEKRRQHRVPTTSGLEEVPEPVEDIDLAAENTESIKNQINARLGKLSILHRVIFLMYSPYHNEIYNDFIAIMAEYFELPVKPQEILVIRDIVDNEPKSKILDSNEISKHEFAVIKLRNKRLIRFLKSFEEVKLRKTSGKEKSCSVKEIALLLSLPNKEVKQKYDYVKSQMRKFEKLIE